MLTTDPERMRGSRIVANVFPKHARSSTRSPREREFKRDARPVLRRRDAGRQRRSIGDLLSSMDEDVDDEGGVGGGSDDVSRPRTTSW